MPPRRYLSAAGLIALVLLGARPALSRVEFLSPTDGEILLGETIFRFDVDEETPTIDRIDVYVAGALVGSARHPAWSFAWTAPQGLVGATILAVVYGSGDEVLEQVRITTSEAELAEAIDVKAVQLYPTVVDRRGRYVRRLPKESFAVFDEGREVSIDFFSEVAGGLNLSFLMDISGSMEGKLRFVQEAAGEFIDHLKPEDRVSAYAFNDGLQTGPLESFDRDAVRSYFLGLSAAGGTALFDAASEVLRDFKGTPGRKALVVFSDGRDELSLLSATRVVRLATEAEVTIYTVGAGENKKNLADRDDLRKLADETGGTALFFQSYQKLGEVFGRILSDLRAQYWLSFTPIASENEVHQVVVRVDDPRYSVRHRKSYVFRTAE